jgi:hypothetical protein
MPAELPYLASYKNVGALFEKIRTAKVPEALTTSFLSETLGFKSSGDRALITLLKALGFLDPSGKPTKEYSILKHEKQAKLAIAAAVRKAYEPLYAANENAHALPQDEIKGLVAQVAGSDDNMTTKIVGTFKALCAAGDFSAQPEAGPAKAKPKADEGDDRETAENALKKGLRPDFHYNIQIHLPANGTEETYISIFNALRKVFR